MISMYEIINLVKRLKKKLMRLSLAIIFLVRVFLTRNWVITEWVQGSKLRLQLPSQHLKQLMVLNLLLPMVLPQRLTVVEKERTMLVKVKKQQMLKPIDLV